MEHAAIERKRRPAKISHLVNWFFGNFCARCGRIDMEEENYGRNCFDKIRSVGGAIKAPEMTHAEFVRIIKSSTFCKPLKRAPPPECPVCRALGVPRRKF